MSCVTINSTPIPAVTPSSIHHSIITGTSNPGTMTSNTGVASSISSSVTIPVSGQNSVSSINVNILPTTDASQVHQVLSKHRLQDLIREVDPNVQTDEETDELLLQLAEEFIDNVVETSCQLAKHRKGTQLESRDVQLSLEKNWNMFIPGFGCEEVRPYKKSTVTEAHKQRMALIRKTLKK